MGKVKVEAFIQDFAKEIEDNNAAIFAGAGLSVGNGFVDWKGLLRPLAEELSLDIDQESDLVRVAQYHVNHHGDNRSDLIQAILNGFATKTAKITPNHQILARLPIGTYWTTNYDSCIEDALQAAGKSADVKHASEHLLTTLHGRQAVVYKMHGHYRDPQHAVLTKADFETYHIKRADFLTALGGDLMSKTFLFIGYSFGDPNLDYVLGRLYTKYQGIARKHYCFVREEAARPSDKPGELDYRKAKQTLFIRDLERYNIRAVMVQRYEEITEILRQIETRYKSRTIFVSGSAHEYGAWPQSDALKFVHDLGGSIVHENYKIVTGLGLGVGSTVLDGALTEIYHKQRRSLTDQVVIRPFPQSAQGQALWPAYREDMLSFAGMSVYMFGNKVVDGADKVQPANGMKAEFDIAVRLGVKVLPLGFTEYVARELYQQVDAGFSNYYPNATPAFRALFVQLGDATRALSDQLKTTLDALNELHRQ